VLAARDALKGGELSLFGLTPLRSVAMPRATLRIS